MSDELLTADEMATRLRVRPETLRGWSRRGLIPAVRISRKTVRFDPDAVMSALTALQDERQECSDNQ